MASPPARNVMWRSGFSVAPSYSYNGLNCGGMYTQHSINGGKCGVCGDGWNSARKHDVGGPFASGIIAKTYEQGSTIDVDILLTANHKGYFEFRVCAYTDESKEVTQECLDKNQLTINGNDLKYRVNSNEKQINLKVKLPDGFSCTHCLFQWHYRAGNSWGSDSEGTGIGFGPQEEYNNCADIQITPKTGVTSTATTLGTNAPATFATTIGTTIGTTYGTSYRPNPTGTTPTMRPPVSSSDLRQLTSGIYISKFRDASYQEGRGQIACALRTGGNSQDVEGKIKVCLRDCGKEDSPNCPTDCFCVWNVDSMAPLSNL